MNDHAERDASEELGDVDQPSAAEEDTLDELESGEGEGFESEEFDELEAAEAGAGGALEEMEAFEEEEEEGFEAWGDDFEADQESAEGFEDALADALLADDADEFLARLLSGVAGLAGGVAGAAGRARGIAQTAQRVARGVGAAASSAQTIARRARRIAQRAQRARSPGGYLLQQLGQYLNQRMDEYDALEDLSDWYADEQIDEAIPALGALVARTAAGPLLRRAATGMGRAAARELVRSGTRAVHTLVRRQGRPAVRAMPRLARSVARVVARRRLSPRAAATALQRVASRVAAQPRLVRRLAGRQTMRRPPTLGGRLPRRLVVRGPVEITITAR